MKIMFLKISYDKASVPQSRLLIKLQEEGFVASEKN